MSESQIRDSQINALFEKVQKKNYGKYLCKIVLTKVRGFTNKVVSFDFPVTAIVGPNGGGKTTILGAAGCAYKEVPPRRFFSKSGKLDDSMANWSIEYELIDKNHHHDTIRRTARFKSLKWSRDALDRTVVIFGVARTVPASERPELSRYAVSSFKFLDESKIKLEKSTAQAISRILGKDVSDFSKIKINDEGSITLLAGTTSNTTYSEFHFGAGESSIIRMVTTIDALPENSLVLIEEIENGLHPIATIRMVEYLIGVAEKKRIQVIFTTHSNDAVKSLPDRAIWAAVNNEVFQGKLQIESLRAITGQIEAQLAIFVEDPFAKSWVEAILRASPDANVSVSVEVHAMSGDGTAVKINKHHNLDPTKKCPSLCIIDGDSKQNDSIEDRVFRLPGESPEGYIFDKVLEKFDTVGGQLTVALHQKFEAHEKLKNVLQQIRRETIDPHLLYSIVGKQLGLLPESTARGAFLAVWTHVYPDETNLLLQQILTGRGQQA